VKISYIIYRRLNSLVTARDLPATVGIAALPDPIPADIPRVLVWAGRDWSENRDEDFQDLKFIENLDLVFFKILISNFTKILFTNFDQVLGNFGNTFLLK